MCSPDGGVVACFRHELGGDRRTPRTVVAQFAASGWGRVARPGTVGAGRAVGAVGRVGRAGKVVVRATRTRLLIRRSDRAVASSCCVCVCMQCDIRFDSRNNHRELGRSENLSFDFRAWGSIPEAREENSRGQFRQCRRANSKSLQTAENLPSIDFYYMHLLMGRWKMHNFVTRRFTTAGPSHDPNAPGQRPPMSVSSMDSGDPGAFGALVYEPSRQ